MLALIKGCSPQSSEKNAHHKLFFSQEFFFFFSTFMQLWKRIQAHAMHPAYALGLTAQCVMLQDGNNQTDRSFCSPDG